MNLPAGERQALLVQLVQQHILGEITQGQLLHYLRKKVFGLSQTQFATLVDVSRRTLTDLEQDKARPGATVVNKVFKPFGLHAGLIPIRREIAQEVFALKPTIDSP